MPQRLCIFHYIGGKHNVVKKLLPLIPEHEIYVEVFGGVPLHRPQDRMMSQAQEAEKLIETGFKHV